MSSDVEIKIFGTVADPESIWDVAICAANEGRINWMETFEKEAFLDMLVSAANEGRALTLTRGRTTDFFDDLTGACQDAGLSYVVSFGQSGAEGFTEGFSWRPGMGQELHFMLDGKKPVLPVLRVTDVQKAAQRGIEAVNSLIDATFNKTRVGKIEIEPGFVEAYRAFVADADPMGTLCR